MRILTSCAIFLSKILTPERLSLCFYFCARGRRGEHSPRTRPFPGARDGEGVTDKSAGSAPRGAPSRGETEAAGVAWGLGVGSAWSSTSSHMGIRGVVYILGSAEDPKKRKVWGGKEHPRARTVCGTFAGKRRRDKGSLATRCRRGIKKGVGRGGGDGDGGGFAHNFCRLVVCNCVHAPGVD